MLCRAWTGFVAHHELITDRIEAGTYAIAAAITGGHLEIFGAHLEHLGSVGAALEAPERRSGRPIAA